VVAEMKAEPDLHRLVVLWVRHVVTIGDRVAGLAVALSRAADADPEAASLVERIDEERRTGARGFVSHLQARGVLRPGLTVEAGADMCWMLANPMVLRRLRDERGWTTGEVQDWLVRLVEASLFE
jgi:hypothetical protein